MRITNGMMINNVLRDLNSGMYRMSKYSSQLASNRKMVNLSDDPVGLLNSLNARQQLRQITQYRNNLTTMRKWTQQAETAVTDINDTIKAINELVIDAAGTKTESDKQNIATQIKQLKAHLVDTLNASIGGKYIFGGFNTTKKPFTVDDSGQVLYNGINLGATTGKTDAAITSPAGTADMQWGGAIDPTDKYTVQDVSAGGETILKFTSVTTGKDIDVKVADANIKRVEDPENPGTFLNTLDLSADGLGEITWTDTGTEIGVADVAAAVDGHSVSSDMYDQQTEIVLDPEKPFDIGTLDSLDWEGPITRNGKFYMEANGDSVTIRTSDGVEVATEQIVAASGELDLSGYGLGKITWTDSSATSAEDIAAAISSVGYMTTLIGEESSQNIKMEIGYELTMNATFTGIDVVGLGEDNMFKILDDLIADLDSGAANETLTLYLGKLSTVQDRILTNLVDLGARSKRLDTMANRYELDFINAEAVRTDIEDIDQAETIMNMKFAESIYQQALAAGAKIIQPTLMDFLR